MKVAVLPQHRSACSQLLKSGALPYSACGKSLIAALKPLFDSEIIRREKAAGGQRLAVVNPDGFQRWFQQHFPAGEVPGSDSSQIKAVARFRNAKALRSNLPEIVCLRSTRDGGLSCGGTTVETTQATTRYGLLAFTLDNNTQFTLDGTCALVENLAVFHSFERLQLEPSQAIWTGGVSSNRFIEWLNVCVKMGAKILHLPDYDPVGLSEYLRLREKLGNAVSLYEPKNLQYLFRHHSKTSLLTDPRNQRMLMQLRKSENPTVRRVVDLMDEFNGGLEHEALFIAKPASP